MAQVISEEPLPGWLSSRPGMLQQTRNQMVGPIEGLRLLGERGVRVVRDREISCGCFVDAEDDRHFDQGVLLNPDQDTVGERNIALLYENLMYVGRMTAAYTENNPLPIVRVGQADSMWWVASTLEPGWYDNAGSRVEYEFNPAYLAQGAYVMPTRVANGTRAIGQVLRWEGSRGHVTTGPDITTDRGSDALRTWVLDTYIAPIPQHRPSLPAAVPVEFVDSTAELTHEQKVTRLNERFTALTQATVSLAKDEDWCGDYDEASRRMGLSEDDYSRTANTEPTSFEVSITVRYELDASALDSIISDRFGGSHDIQMSLDVESPIQVTVTQEGEEFDQSTHDWDDILDSAGYSDYEDIDITSWRTI